MRFDFLAEIIQSIFCQDADPLQLEWVLASLADIEWQIGAGSQVASRLYLALDSRAGTAEWIGEKSYRQSEVVFDSLARGS